MREARVPLTKVQDALQRLGAHHRLAGLVRSMALEIERLDEDNIQLQAAVKIYREVVRRYNARACGYPSDRKPAAEYTSRQAGGGRC